MGWPVWRHYLCLVHPWRLALCLFMLALQHMHQRLSDMRRGARLHEQEQKGSPPQCTVLTGRRAAARVA